MFLSNRVETLFEIFRERLYSKEAPFAKRLVVIPSLAMKNWLIQRLAESECKIAMGIEWYGLDESIARLLELLTTGSTQNIPSALEFSFAIEQEFRALERHARDPVWLPIKNYLKYNDALHVLSPKGEKRAISLSIQLGKLFSRYALLGHSTLNQWKTRPSQEWQEALWKTLYDTHADWSDWHTLLEANPTFALPAQPLEVHLFSISYIPALFFKFFERLTDYFPVSFYQLSPCHGYWEDLVSDRKGQWIQRQDRDLGASLEHQNALEELLRDKNPLLANFGRLGREMAELIEESPLPKETFYSLPETFWKLPQYEEFLYDEFHPEPTDRTAPSLLEYVQGDLLLMRSPSKETQIECQEQEVSIKVIRAASPMREVQQLHDELSKQRLRFQDSEPAFQPEEVLILVPDLARYVPFLRCVFQEQESGFPIRILEWTLASQSPIIQAYQQLLSLSDSRWDCTEIFQLLSAESFCRKLGWEEEELQQIKSWLEQANIWWGDSAEHRDEILFKRHCALGMPDRNATGTWRNGFERLLCGLALIEPVEDLPSPCRMEPSKTSLLNRFFHIVYALKDDLEALTSDQLLTISGWCGYLKALYSSYLEPDSSSIWDREGQNTLLHALDTLQRAADPEACFPFSSVKARLIELLNSSESSHEEGNLAAIRIAGLLPMRTQPARFLAILGMDEESFPRRDPIQALDKLAKSGGGDYYPSQNDADRYLFLEALLSARETLWISFTGFSNEGQEIAPSPLVEELLSQLDTGYRINGRSAKEACFTTAPFHAHDMLHFTPESPLTSFSHWRYRLACANQFPAKESEPPFPKVLRLSETEDVPAVTTLTIKQFIQLARHPIEFHYRAQFGLYISDKSSQPVPQEHFVLPALQHSALTKQALKQPLNQVMQQSVYAEAIPLGIFGEVAKLRLLDISEPAKEWLQTLGLGSDPVFEIELNEAYSEPCLADAHCWKLPPLLLRTHAQHPLKLIGTLDFMTLQGLLLAKENKPDTRYECIPQLLIMQELAAQFKLPLQSRALFAKNRKTWELTPTAHRLERWIDYLFLAQRHPIPLLPKWVNDFLKGDVEGLQAKLNSIGESSFEPDFYTFEQWLWQERSKPDAETLMRQWQPLALELFSQEQS